MDSGADAVTQWLKEEGINAPLGSVLLVRALRTTLQSRAGPPAALGVSRLHFINEPQTALFGSRKHCAAQDVDIHI